MVDGQFAGVSHFSTQSYSLFGVRQTNGKRLLIFDNNGKESIATKVSRKTIWLKSTWGDDGKSQYAYSLDGKIYFSVGNTYQLTWGSYRGDRISTFNFNTMQDKGFIDVDWFRYEY